MIKKELILLDVDCENREEVLRKLAAVFVENGRVKESFTNAVVEREKVYPTGLPAEAFDIAIPHTVSEHVIEPAIAVAVLRKPVEFQQMGSPEITLHPQLVMMMAIKDPKEQTTLLRKMMKMLQNSELLTAVKESKTPQEVVDLMVPALA